MLKHLPTAALDEAEPELKKLSVAAAKAKRDVPADAKQVVGKVEQEFSPLEHKVDQMSSQLCVSLLLIFKKRIMGTDTR